jgi:opacity protein-like surface antigen
MTIRSLASGLAAFAALGAAGVQADEPRPFDQNPAFANEKLPRVYAGVAGGAVFPNEFDTSLQIDIGGEKLKASADMQFDTGQAVGGLIGYAVTKRIAIEAELGHATFAMDQLDLSLSKGRHRLEGSVKVDGEVDAWTGFGNVVVAPLGVGIITPYVGAGAGFAHFDFDIKSAEVFGGQIPIGADQSETKLALKGIVGANLALGYHFGLGARYSYIWADTSTEKNKSATFSGIPIKDKGHVGDFTAGTLFISGNLAF